MKTEFLGHLGILTAVIERLAMSWVIRKFKNIQVVIFSQSECIRNLVVNMDDFTEKVVRIFGPAAERLYSFCIKKI